MGEGVDEAAPSARGRLRGHPADRLFGDPEPHLAAGGVELGPEPERAVRLPGGLARRQDLRAAGPIPAPAGDDDRELAVGTAELLEGVCDSRPRPARRRAAPASPSTTGVLLSVAGAWQGGRGRATGYRLRRPDGLLSSSGVGDDGPATRTRPKGMRSTTARGSGPRRPLRSIRRSDNDISSARPTTPTATSRALPCRPDQVNNGCGRWWCTRRKPR